MNENFEQIIGQVTEYEGRVNGFMGYVNHPRDPGGETVTGISRRYWPKFSGWPMIDTFKKGFEPDLIASGTNFDRGLYMNAALWEEVKKFYKTNFWDTIYLDSIESYRAALVMFDSNVLLGSAWVSWAQEIANEIHSVMEMIDLRPALWPILEVDGGLGPKSIAALTMIFKQKMSIGDGDLAWATELLNRREAFHREKVAEDPSLDPFLLGWINRVDKLRKEIGA